jgi:hypothetical protein
MRTLMKAALVAAMLFATVSGMKAQVSIGVIIGPPPPPRVVRVLEPPPDPDFIWVEGYWYPVGRHYLWHEGYWTRAPYEGARWVPPRYDGRQFFAGYWEGDHGRVEHDHRWDRDHDRDHDWDHDRGHHRGHYKGHHRGDDQGDDDR